MNPAANYKRMQILTASPAELLIMYYNELLKCIRLGRAAIEEQNPAMSGEKLGKAQDILHELMNMLDPEIAPELADSLSGLYNYCSRTLLQAVAERDPARCDEVHDLLLPLRAAWVEAAKQLKAQSDGGKASQ